MGSGRLSSVRLDEIKLSLGRVGFCGNIFGWLVCGVKEVVMCCSLGEEEMN